MPIESPRSQRDDLTSRWHTTLIKKIIARLTELFGALGYPGLRRAVWRNSYGVVRRTHRDRDRMALRCDGKCARLVLRDAWPKSAWV